MNGPVVVGVDGSPSSLDAVAAAAHEARLRGVGLRVVHAFLWPVLHVPLGPSPMGPPEGGLRNMADQLVAQAVEHARGAEAGIEVEGEVVVGEPLTVLEARSQTASLVVVGSRGLGGFTGLLLGSTAVHLSAHSRCPVLVVRGRPDPTGHVLLGVDGSASGEAAVGFAFAEASARGAALVAMHTWNNWTGPVSGGPAEPLPLVYDVDMLRDEEERAMAEALSGWQAKYPDVTVHRQLVQGGARQALIEASGSAQLLVVGARGRGGFSGLLLGSVSQAALHHAHCPVAVVRAFGADRKE
ncbi:universal stress protein [Streptomyces pini]|uniref:Nucleotide-binding universal stress protein, UspA family n=1 Tax=Streptomyces pini TaxID=1520580 RepID=A0A1I4D108_9ACTN|nr:universal stress protein [Streptomyces pini]SFK85781.1 Nucleotide-binding universal stress protein, UspA family [Streptomyces pini]